MAESAVVVCPAICSAVLWCRAPDDDEERGAFIVPRVSKMLIGRSSLSEKYATTYTADRVPCAQPGTNIPLRVASDYSATTS